MGCSFSCKNLISSPPPKSKTIKIVGLNGLVQEIGYPITVAEVTGKPGKHFLFTQPQLLAAATATPLKLEAQLEAGRVYFLLPTSLFQTTILPEELGSIARRLASVARNTPSKSTDDQVFNGMSKSGKSRSWKPVLSTIRERSFNRRSESDLQAEDFKIDTKEQQQQQQQQ